MEVSRPDFMGLGHGLISVSRFKGFGLARDYSIETTRPAKMPVLGLGVGLGY